MTQPTSKVNLSVPLRRSVATFMLLRTFSLYLLVTLIVTTGQVWFEYNNIRNYLLSDLNSMMEAELPQITYGVWELDYQGMKANLEGALKHSALVGIKLTKPDGQLMLRGGLIPFGNQKIGYVEGVQVRHQETLWSEPAEQTGQGSLIEVKRELHHKGIKLGDVAFYSSRTEVFARLKANLVAILVTASLKTFAIWAIFLLFARKIIHRPLARLSEAAARLNLDQPQPVKVGLEHPRQDEIAYLEDSFNRMSIRLHHSFLEIQELNRSLEANQEGLERKVAQRTEELADLNRQKDQFFSIISHDLRGPIGSMSLLLEVMIEDPSKVDFSLIEVMHRTTGSLFSLLNQLLDWSSIQQDQLELQTTNLTLTELFQEGVDLFSGQAIQKEIHLEILPSQDVFAYADRNATATIIRNFIGNAIKFSPLGGTIQVQAQAQAGQSKITVKDEGRGLSELDQSKLFKAGEKVVSRPGTAQERGNGLGLILCAELVRKMGGQIGVESTEGEGSVFWFSIPTRHLSAL